MRHERRHEALVVPAIVARHATLSGDLQVLEPPLSIPPFAIYLCWPERRHYDDGHRWLRQAVLDQVRAVLGVETEPDATTGAPEHAP